MYTVHAVQGYLCMLCVFLSSSEGKASVARLMWSLKVDQYISEVYIAQHVTLHGTPVLGGRSAWVLPITSLLPRCSQGRGPKQARMTPIVTVWRRNSSHLARTLSDEPRMVRRRRSKCLHMETERPGLSGWSCIKQGDSRAVQACAHNWAKGRGSASVLTVPGGNSYALCVCLVNTRRSDQSKSSCQENGSGMYFFLSHYFMWWWYKVWESSTVYYVRCLHGELEWFCGNLN